MIKHINQVTISYQPSLPSQVLLYCVHEHQFDLLIFATGSKLRTWESEQSMSTSMLPSFCVALPHIVFSFHVLRALSPFTFHGICIPHLYLSGGLYFFLSLSFSLVR